ncbi:MAG: SAM-dependent methyltransferase, partial [Gammaproteobacteria bacterium]|nr:SAM-dependent methyltransferase [Gammaproteobacteria bacterium]NIR21789.1 SAM-dependent methyltransferase [Gammaproteobacteria bacterium]NIS03493.1 SAM-dependent methyltransferase [Gammaproteobacteria bacterium]NIU39986.1 SAM-dependent methyltransferase [Gammaproteobacteria bacterium]NIV45375.1 SAM-dependent methyltransferase [Gammaproteobacteria bacterium]
MPVTPENESRGGNAALVARVREAIDAAGGSISFAEYMDLA